MRRSVQFYRSGKPGADRFAAFARPRHSVSTMPAFECRQRREARVFRIAVAVAFTGAIVLASGDADARARFRMSSPSSKPAAAAAPVAKPMAGQAQKPGATEPQKPFAAARPANPQPVGGGTFVVIGGPRPAGAAPGQGAPQRALGDDSSGPLQFDPTLAAADDKAAEPKKETAAAPATECIALAQALAARPPQARRARRRLRMSCSSQRISRSPPTTRRRPSLRRARQSGARAGQAEAAGRAGRGRRLLRAARRQLRAVVLMLLCWLKATEVPGYQRPVPRRTARSCSGDTPT